MAAYLAKKTCNWPRRAVLSEVTIDSTQFFTIWLGIFTKKHMGLILSRQQQRCCKESGIRVHHAIFVNGNWSNYGDLIPWISSRKVMVLIAPVWIQHAWYGLVMDWCSHIWILPQTNGVFTSKARGPVGKIGAAPWCTFLAFGDFRTQSTLVPCVSASGENIEALEAIANVQRPRAREM